jgi:hypothetical protein
MVSSSTLALKRGWTATRDGLLPLRHFERGRPGPTVCQHWTSCALIFEKPLCLVSEGTRAAEEGPRGSAWNAQPMSANTRPCPASRPCNGRIGYARRRPRSSQPKRGLRPPFRQQRGLHEDKMKSDQAARRCAVLPSRHRRARRCIARRPIFSPFIKRRGSHLTPLRRIRPLRLPSRCSSRLPNQR